MAVPYNKDMTYNIGDELTVNIPVKNWRNKTLTIQGKVKSIRGRDKRKFYTITKGKVLKDFEVYQIEK